MGGAIATLFLQRYQHQCDAIALCAPMFGIVMRLPDWMVRHILDWAEGHQRIREEYAIGTGRWRALPFAINVLTHSRQRYRRNLRFYADEPRCASAARPGTGCGKASWPVSRCWLAWK
jgi:lysophospholipase